MKHDIMKVWHSMIYNCFYKLKPYLENEMITDINYNGKDLWLDHLREGRLLISNFMTECEAYKMCLKFSNAVNKNLNLQNPVLEADLNFFRVSIIHPSITGSIAISIRKSTDKLRLNEETMLAKEYISKSALNFLKYCVQSRVNLMISGLPGSGKTELLKFLTQYIHENERVITIEDSYELHYQSLHPNRDCVAIKVNRFFPYEKAIVASLRQRADWILLSEVRGQEIIDLLNSASTGTHLMSTIHAQSAREIPLRMRTMIPSEREDLRSQIEQLIHVGVHIDLYMNEQGIHRRVREIVVFNDKDSEYVYHYSNKRDARKIPDIIKEKGKIYGAGYW